MFLLTFGGIPSRLYFRRRLPAPVSVGNVNAQRLAALSQSQDAVSRLGQVTGGRRERRAQQGRPMPGLQLLQAPSRIGAPEGTLNSRNGNRAARPEKDRREFLTGLIV